MPLGSRRRSRAARWTSALNFAAPLVVTLDAGDPITVLAGVHPAASSYSETRRSAASADLKGKSVGIQALGSTPHRILDQHGSLCRAGSRKDINWVTSPSVKPMDALHRGEIDAFLGFPPEPQELRARNIGHVVVNSAVDRPWSQYFCCMLAGNADFVRQQPDRDQACRARHSQSGGPLCL